MKRTLLLLVCLFTIVGHFSSAQETPEQTTTTGQPEKRQVNPLKQMLGSISATKRKAKETADTLKKIAIMKNALLEAANKTLFEHIIDSVKRPHRIYWKIYLSMAAVLALIATLALTRCCGKCKKGRVANNDLSNLEKLRMQLDRAGPFPLTASGHMVEPQACMTLYKLVFSNSMATIAQQVKVLQRKRYVAMNEGQSQAYKKILTETAALCDGSVKEGVSQACDHLKLAEGVVWKTFEELRADSANGEQLRKIECTHLIETEKPDLPTKERLLQMIDFKNEVSTNAKRAYQNDEYRSFKELLQVDDQIKCKFGLTAEQISDFASKIDQLEDLRLGTQS